MSFERDAVSYQTTAVILPRNLSQSEDLLFLQATLFETPRLPFAIVNYAIRGAVQDMGLRLDLDKQVFLDHFEGSSDEAVASAAAPLIVTYLATRDHEIQAGAGA